MSAFPQKFMTLAELNSYIDDSANMMKQTNYYDGRYGWDPHHDYTWCMRCKMTGLKNAPRRLESRKDDISCKQCEVCNGCYCYNCFDAHKGSCHPPIPMHLRTDISVWDEDKKGFITLADKYKTK